MDINTLPPIIIENKRFALTLSGDCTVQSLVCKANGEELAAADEKIAFFSSTQERPFNNEVKLAHPNKRTTFEANRVRREGDKLIVGFEIIPYEAVIAMRIEPNYIAFTLEDFIIHGDDYPGLRMSPPPVAELRIIQLPALNRESFGEWLNVSWDEKTAVNVLSVSPYARIDSERRKGCRVMYADAVRSIKLKGTGAALIVSETKELLDCIDSMERDFGLPLGVESRRGKGINRSSYWTAGINLSNVDEHIKWAKKGGFQNMLIYYTAIFKEQGGYALNGNYDYNDSYPNGKKDLTELLTKIRAAGITPGFHFLQTHIGLQSRYCTPVADHRLNKTQLFTLSKPLCDTGDTIYVEQNPDGVVMDEACRVLQFGGELIKYTDYVTEPPYSFIGCVRGAYGTNITAHPTGEIGGILDVSEFGGSSVYLDQNSSLQDEVADKISDAYNCGFGFVYFDGSEGTNVPNGFHVPNAQYRVYKKLKPAPVYCEGAAKAHFGWHFLSGGNAFDVFPPSIFKDMIRKYPAEEAPRMQKDFTRLDFGWWGFWKEMQPDMLEFGTSRAAAWNCPATLMSNIGLFNSHPRMDDIMEVMRRWEEVRELDILTEDDKLALRDLSQEHIMLINEEKKYELAPYTQFKNASGGDTRISAFGFERGGESFVVYWRNDGDGELKLPLTNFTLQKELYKEPIEVKFEGDISILPLGCRCYIRTKQSLDTLEKAFERAEIL